VLTAPDLLHLALSRRRPRRSALDDTPSLAPQQPDTFPRWRLARRHDQGLPGRQHDYLIPLHAVVGRWVGRRRFQFLIWLRHINFDDRHICALHSAGAQASSRFWRDPRRGRWCRPARDPVRREQLNRRHYPAGRACLVPTARNGLVLRLVGLVLGRVRLGRRPAAPIGGEGRRGWAGCCSRPDDADTRAGPGRRPAARSARHARPEGQRPARASKSCLHYQSLRMVPNSDLASSSHTPRSRRRASHTSPRCSSATGHLRFATWPTTGSTSLASSRSPRRSSTTRRSIRSTYRATRAAGPHSKGCVPRHAARADVEPLR